MWGGWSGVTKKLKDIAIEIATPQYEQAGGTDDEAEEQQHQQARGYMGVKEVEPDETRRELLPVLQQAQDERGGIHTPLSKDSVYTYQASNSSHSSKSHCNANTNNNSNKLSGLVSEQTPATPPVRRSGSSEVVLMPPSRNPSSKDSPSNIGKIPISAGESPLKSLEKSSVREEERDGELALNTMTGANGSVAVCNYEETIADLRGQLHAISEQKKQMEGQIREYQREVTEAHEKTAAYYEQRILTLQGQLETEKETNKKVKEELQLRDSECVKLQTEVQVLLERVDKLVKESETITLAHNEAKEALLSRENEYMKAMQQVESLQDAHNALVEELEGVRRSLTSTTAATASLLTSTTATIATVPVAYSDALMEKQQTVSTQHATVEEVRKHAERLERESVSMQQERDQLFQLLKEEECAHRATSEEKDELLRRGEHQARRLTELIQQLENNQQKERQRRQMEEYNKGDDKTPVESKQDEELEQRVSKESIASLQREVTALKSELEAARHETAETSQRVESKLTAEQTCAMTAFTEQQQSKAAIHAIQCELREAQERAMKAETERTALQEELQQLHDRLSEADSQTAALSNKLDAAETKVAELQSSLVATRAANASMGQEASKLAALTSRKRELEAENAHTHELLQQLEHTITECLVRADVELPPPSSQCGDIWASYSNKVILIASEFNRLVDASRRAAHVQKEWERTYEQARSVNATLTQQVNEAWKTIGTIREDLSVRDQLVSKLKQELQAEKQQYRDSQQALSGVTNELQALKEKKKLWETQMTMVVDGGSSATSKNSSGIVNQQDLIAGLNADIDTLKKALHERDEELSQAQRSLDNLQQVLDTFTQNKTRDVEERTVDMQIEIDELRAKLEAAEEQRQGHKDNIDSLVATHRREIAAKSLEITSMHRKLAELRRALDESARQLNAGMMIDKRVISHLTVNYIHAFVGRRPEADEMLKVLSGLLNWDEAMQEKAGLLPGPTNPRPGQQGRRRGFIGGLVHTVLGDPGRPRERATVGDQGYTGRGGATPSISELWVEFLLRESEAGVRDAAVELPQPPAETTTTTTSSFAAAINSDKKDSRETVADALGSKMQAGGTPITDGENHNSEEGSAK